MNNYLLFHFVYLRLCGDVLFDSCVIDVNRHRINELFLVTSDVCKILSVDAFTILCSKKFRNVSVVDEFLWIISNYFFDILNIKLLPIVINWLQILKIVLFFFHVTITFLPHTFQCLNIIKKWLSVHQLWFQKGLNLCVGLVSGIHVVF